MARTAPKRYSAAAPRPRPKVEPQPDVEPAPKTPPLSLDQRMLRAMWIDLIGGLSIVPPGRAPEVVDARIAALRKGDQP